MSPPAPDDALDRFLRRFHEDQDAGRELPLEHYQECFPELRDELAGRFGALTGDRRGAPRHVGPYELRGRLGRGGQGDVHRAYDPRARREVAIKSLAHHGALLDPAAAARFRREAEIASRLQHPNICPVYDLDTGADPPYLVMPLLEGASLQELLATRRVPGEGWPADESAERATGGPAAAVQRVLLLGERIARALHAAHQAGIVHRDVKPGNLWVRADGAPVILDFGLARDSEAEGPTLTRSGQHLGTLPYMSPEQLGGGAVDRRTDVYSLGVTLYECLTGRRPFRGSNEATLRDAILRQEPADASRLDRSLPRDLAVVLATALDKDPRRRYATAADLAADLRAVRTGRPVRARPATAAVRVVRWARRNPALAAALVTAFVALLAGLVVTLDLLARRTEALRERTAALERLEEERARRQLALDVLRLEELPRWADELWPATAATVTAPRGMDDWLEAVHGLRARLPGYRAELAAMRADPGGRPAVRDPRLVRARAELQEELAGLGQALGHVRRTKPDSGWVAEIERRILRRERRLENAPREFDDPARTRRFAALQRLVGGIPGLDGVVAGIEERRAFALSVRRRTVDERAGAWRRAAEAVAGDARFAGFGLAPVEGLVPLGPDPATGLQEFGHPLTGAVPARDGEGRLQVAEGSSLVFVLLPGGTATIGARPPQEGEARSAHTDPHATTAEAPVHEVGLDPFLIARCPMTQGQWQRVTGGNPSQNKAGDTIGGREITLRNPVESVTWHRAREVLGNLGMVLPTEVQWEYAARGGTVSPWWTGWEARSLEGAGNIADGYAASLSGQSTWQYERWLDDGHFVHAPVGSYEPNPFGLYDVIGNVYEWCRDGFSFYGEADARPGDGLRARTLMLSRAARGAGYSSPAVAHRSAARARFSPEMKVYYLGVRPVMEGVPAGGGGGR